MASVSHKLSNSFEGALAGGGDPATSPVYVFGPFPEADSCRGRRTGHLRRQRLAGHTYGSDRVRNVSPGDDVGGGWSGGSGLSEEEFGGWAVKINAGITFIEYALTFLVSMAALVTFIADRLPILDHSVLGIQYRTFVGIVYVPHRLDCEPRT